MRNLCRPRASSISRISRRGSTDQPVADQTDQQDSKWIAKINFQNGLWRMYFIYKHMHIAVDNFSHKAFFGDCQKTTTQNQKKRRNICENRKVRE